MLDKINDDKHSRMRTAVPYLALVRMRTGPLFLVIVGALKLCKKAS